MLYEQLILNDKVDFLFGPWVGLQSAAALAQQHEVRIIFASLPFLTLLDPNDQYR